MVRYFLELKYDGSAFHGWQLQPNASTVQEEIERQLKVLLRQDVSTIGCGRTDTGVHAQQFYLHFDYYNDLPYSDVNFVYKLNKLLPAQIAILKIFKVPVNIHARFSAISRTYQYFIHFKKDPFVLHSWEIIQQLNVEQMRFCGQVLKSFTDFSSFAKLHADTKTNDCELQHFEIIERQEGIIIEIRANRFLRNMVRAIVGTLVDVGLGKINTEEFKGIVEAKNRSFASASAPAKGLFLQQVKYPENVK